MYFYPFIRNRWLFFLDLFIYFPLRPFFDLFLFHLHSTFISYLLQGKKSYCFSDMLKFPTVANRHLTYWTLDWNLCFTLWGSHILQIWTVFLGPLLIIFLVPVSSFPLCVSIPNVYGKLYVCTASKGESRAWRTFQQSSRITFGGNSLCWLFWCPGKSSIGSWICYKQIE